MKFIETESNGVYIMESERSEDERGFFARTFCQKEFKVHGLNLRIVKCSISYNKSKGTLNGMHYQVASKAEAKLVRCTKEAIYDMVIDIIPAFGIEWRVLNPILSESNNSYPKLKI